MKNKTLSKVIIKFPINVNRNQDKYIDAPVGSDCRQPVGKLFVENKGEFGRRQWQRGF